MDRVVEPTTKFPFLVMVYGTLKEGFYNYAAVMQPLQEGGHFVKLHDRAETKGFLFVDAYYVPYLVVGSSSVSEDSTITGEVYGVDQVMLDDLDELEGVGQGRYTRSEVTVRLLNSSETDESEVRETQCFIYHLEAVPSVVGEQGIQSMPCYDFAGHKEKYVPKQDRDQSRYKEWGGYE
jgi:gamma-glutamylcyclotransferase (GGCT)/AIG2-like uncharacterized protein YtfP